MKTMNMTVATKLEAARVGLDELSRLTIDLAAAHPAVFEDPCLRERMAAFSKAHIEARERLALPTLSIATIGTTSSGKSTIVNALVGRRIAPMDSGEMSGGVLTLRDSDERRLIVESSEDASWDSGVWSGMSDDEAYSRIRNDVMLRYHAARKRQECLAPQVLCEGPLLPARDEALLGLPTDLGVEFIDLPGLKSVQDRANLSVIQARVHKAFSLVALDYLQTDEDHRKKLLEELTHVVKYLQGSTDSMIFVLNRVDQRGSDDEPIAKRIADLRKEIQGVLGLKQEPEVIPFEARLLYRVQCAWGPTSDDMPEVPREQRLQYLSEFFKECASTIERHGEADESLEQWLLDLKRSVRKNQDLAPEQVRRLLHLARDWSGGTQLWQRLRARIEDSFAELVILPALIEVFDTHRSLVDSLRTVSKIRKIDSREQLENQRKHLEHVQVRLHAEVSATRERFRNQLTSAADGLKTGDQAVRHRFTKELGPGFESLMSAVNEVTGDLAGNLIAPVRDALKISRGVYDLEDELARVLPPSVAKELSGAYDQFRGRIGLLTLSNGVLSACFREDDVEGVEKLTEIERDARRLYQCMRESMAKRAEFTLQGQARVVREVLTGLVEQQADAITSALLSELPDVAMEKAIESARRVSTRMDLLDLPSSFFTLPAAIERKSDKQEEVVGQKQVEEEYSDGSRVTEGALSGAAAGAAIGVAVGGPAGAAAGALIGLLFGGGGGATLEVKKTRTVTKDVKATITYLKLELPDVDGMARQWSDGVRSSEGALWETLRDWMIEALKEESVSFSSAIESVLRLADRALEDQQRLASDEYADVMALWKGIDREVEYIETFFDRLSRSAKSGME